MQERLLWTSCLAMALLLAAGVARAQNTSYIIDTFYTGIPSQWWSTWWGNGSITFDPGQDAGGDPNSGADYITADTIRGQNTYVIARSFGGWAWDNSRPVKQQAGQLHVVHQFADLAEVGQSELLHAPEYVQHVG